MFRPKPQTKISETEVALVRARIATLFESHFERVARYIAARTGDHSEAEDLASEVFVRALRSAGSYKETGAPMEAWLFRIAHNIVVDSLRKRSRRPAYVPLEEAWLIAADNNPEEIADRHQAGEVLQAAISKLTSGQQQVLALRLREDLTSNETAAALGKTPGAVREMQSAALKRLRELMTHPVTS